MLGDDTNTNRNTLIKIADGVKDMSAGGAHTLVLKTDNSLWGCGSNSIGQLGDGANPGSYFLVRILFPK
ncbi:MAG: hypothetical protein IPH58_02840 [Sphingobacteriales bacterium]|nr:hypothetical protein [Sphingobacteriales bacterium]